MIYRYLDHVIDNSIFANYIPCLKISRGGGKNVISVFVLTHLPEAWDKWKLWKNLFE